MGCSKKRHQGTLASCLSSLSGLSGLRILSFVVRIRTFFVKAQAKAKAKAQAKAQEKVVMLEYRWSARASEQILKIRIKPEAHKQVKSEE
jgi:hypothetical protein